MTYILGWKWQGSAYLCADTAVTEPGDGPKPSQRSSYGERSFSDTKRTVHEGVMKLFHLGNVAVALCGDIQNARAFIEELSERLKSGQPSIDALGKTVANRTPIDKRAEFKLLIVVNGQEDRRLFAFNMNGDQALTESQDGQLVQFGSIPGHMAGMTQQWLDALVRHFAADSDSMLAISVSMLQSYGVHDYLMDSGVGGTFCGLVADSRGLRWQKDLLTMIYGPKFQPIGMIAAIVRDNVLIVRSNLNNRCGYFGDALMGALDDRWKARWWDDSFEHIRTGRFHFVALISNGQRTLTVAEMRQELKSDYVHITPPPEPRDAPTFGLRVDLSPTVQKQMRYLPDDRGDGTVPMAISWTPFLDRAARERGAPAP